MLDCFRVNKHPQTNLNKIKTSTESGTYYNLLKPVLLRICQKPRYPVYTISAAKRCARTSGPCTSSTSCPRAHHNLGICGAPHLIPDTNDSIDLVSNVHLCFLSYRRPHRRALHRPLNDRNNVLAFPGNSPLIYAGTNLGVGRWCNRVFYRISNATAPSNTAPSLPGSHSLRAMHCKLADD